MKDFHALRAASPTTPDETIPTNAEADPSGVSPTKFISGSPRVSNTTLSKRGIQIMQDLDAMGGGGNDSLEVDSKERSMATTSPRKRMTLSPRTQAPVVAGDNLDNPSVQFLMQQEDESFGGGSSAVMRQVEEQYAKLVSSSSSRPGQTSDTDSAAEYQRETFGRAI